MRVQKPHNMAEARVLCSTKRSYCDLLAGASAFIALNITLIAHYVPYGQHAALLPQILGWNAGFYILCAAVSRYVVQPLRTLAAAIQQLRSTYDQEIGTNRPAPGCNVRTMARELYQLSELAFIQYREHHAIARELEEVRRMSNHIATQHSLLTQATARESRTQYQSVLTYAHYLEERVITKKADPALRYDFDDVCESSFSLALIGNALSQLNGRPEVESEDIALAALIQQTLVKLASALDRRSMKLTTAGVDLSVTARGDPHALQLAVWMILLGIVRYAQDESTLRLRTLPSRDGSHALLSIVISELSPGAMSENERADYLARQLRHESPHMFAQAIRDHAQIQLAELLIAPAGGSVSVTALTATSCEVSLALTAANA